MKKMLSLVLVLMLAVALAAPAAVFAEDGVKLFVPVGSDGNPIKGNSVVAGNYLAADVYFKYVGGGDDTINVIGLDIDTKGGDLAQFPFDPTSSTYYISVGPVDVAATPVVGPYSFNMRCRGDATAGYYGVNFILTYERTTTVTAEDGTQTSQTTTETAVVPWDVLVRVPEDAPSATVGAVPKVLITGFTTNPASVVAGEDFALNVTFKNTSSSNSIDNLKAVLGSDGTFNPVSGSSTMFVQHLDPGASSSLSITLHAKADASPGSYSVKFAMTFDAPGVKDPIVDEESLSIPVVQVPKINVTSIQTMGNMMVGSDLNVMSSVNNTGKSVLYNVMARVHDTGGLLGSEESYLGNIQPGESKNVDVYLGAMSAGDTAVVVSVTYEDENGVSYSAEVTADVSIQEQMSYDDPWMDEPVMPEPEQTGLAWWIYALIGLAAAGIAALVVVRVIKKKKARERDLAEARALDEKYLRDSEDRL